VRQLRVGPLVTDAAYRSCMPPARRRNTCLIHHKAHAPQLGVRALFAGWPIPTEATQGTRSIDVGDLATAIGELQQERARTAHLETVVATMGTQHARDAAAVKTLEEQHAAQHSASHNKARSLAISNCVLTAAATELHHLIHVMHGLSAPL